MGRVAPVLAFSVLLGFATPDAAAQFGHHVRSNRPSAGPSTQLGLVGGRNTLTGARAPARPQGAAVTPSTPGQLGMPTRGRRGRQLDLVRLGTIASPNARSLLRSGYLSQEQIGAYSGFSAAASVAQPLYGQASNLVPRFPQTPIMSLGPERSRFQEFFDLIPARSRDAKPRYETYAALVDSLQEDTNAQVQRNEREAFEAFARATEPDVPPTESFLILRRVTGKLTGVTNLDEDAYLPALIMAHAHFEREQVDSALHSLITVAERHPRAFTERPNVASYFGDYDQERDRSEHLQSQMRAWIRLSSFDPSPNAYVVEAYSAWVLGDETRARRALDNAEEALARGIPASPDLDRLIAALRYAL